MKSVQVGSFVLAASLAATVASAGPITTYAGYTEAPGGLVTGDAQTKRDAFVGALITTSIRTETFEGFPSGAATTLDLKFGTAGPLATLTEASGAIQEAPTDGRFNTSSGGQRFWQTSQSFDVTFASPVSAFGFFATDVGDFAGTLTVRLTPSSSTTTTDFTVNGNTASGSLAFWGFIADDATTYSKVSFNITNIPNTSNTADVFGFDDMIIGTKAAASVPDAGSTFFMLTAAVGALFAVRRRQS